MASSFPLKYKYSFIRSIWHWPLLAMYFKQEGTISILSGKPLKFVGQFTCFGSNISSTKIKVNICIKKAWITIDRLPIIWKSDLFDQIKWDFFQAEAISVLLYGYTCLTLTKRLKKEVNGNYTRMLNVFFFFSNPGRSTPQNNSCRIPNFPPNIPSE